MLRLCPLISRPISVMASPDLLGCQALPGRAFPGKRAFQALPELREARALRAPRCPGDPLSLQVTPPAPHLDVPVGVQQDVLQLQVPVHDPILREEPGLIPGGFGGGKVRHAGRGHCRSRHGKPRVWPRGWVGDTARVAPAGQQEQGGACSRCHRCPRGASPARAQLLLGRGWLCPTERGPNGIWGQELPWHPLFPSGAGA